MYVCVYIYIYTYVYTHIHTRIQQRFPEALCEHDWWTGRRAVKMNDRPTIQ